MTQESLKKAFVIFTAGILLVWYFYVCSEYPFYSTWDMDWIISIDVLLLNQGIMPDHFVHPGFGMVLIFNFTSALFHSLGALSAYNLTEIAQYVQPYLGMGEITDFVRYHSPIVLWLCVTIITLSLRILLRLNWFETWLALLCFGISTSTAQHASMNRTEQYSVLFFCIAFMVVSTLWLKQSSKVKTAQKTEWLLPTIGFLLGLCFSTKIQAAMLCGFLIVFMVSMQPPMTADFDPQRTRKIKLFNFYFFLVFSIVSIFYSIPEEMVSGRDRWGLTPQSFAAIVLIAMSLFTLKRPQFLVKIQKEQPALISMASWILFGFFLSLLPALFLSSNISLNINYFLSLFKVLFWGKLEGGIAGEVNTTRGIYNLLNQKGLLSFLALVLIILGTLQFKKIKTPVFSIKGFLICGFVLIINILFFTRSLNRQDLIWTEFSIPVFIIVSLALLRFSFPIYKKQLTGLLIFFLIFQVASGFVNSQLVLDRSLFTYYQEHKFFKGIYGGNQVLVTQLMNERYGPSERPQISTLSRHIPPNLFASIVRNSPYSSSQIGFMMMDAPLFKNHPTLKIKSYDPELNSLLTYDVSQPRSDFPFLTRILAPLIGHDENIRDYFQNGEQLQLFPRQDYKVYVFRESVTKMSTSLKIELVDSATGQSRVLYGQVLEGMMRLDAASPSELILIVAQPQPG